MLRVLFFSLLPVLLLNAPLSSANQNEADMKPISKEKKMFLILLKYIQPLERVDELARPHVEYLKACCEQSKFICLGPRVPRTGGIILAHVESIDAAWALIKKDPYYIQQIAEYEVIEFKPWMYDPRFDCFVHEQMASDVGGR